MKQTLAGLVCASLAFPGIGAAREYEPAYPKVRHILLLSVDGMHAVDFLNCANGIATIDGGTPYCPSIAALGKSGVNFTAASASKPSDSFPGLMALVAGGGPRSVGAFYDVAYDRSLAPPAKTTGNGVVGDPSLCTPGVFPGTETEYEEGIDLDQSQLNAGVKGASLTDGGIAGIDPLRLPRDPANSCKPVYPWNFVRTNTIFGVVHRAGGYTAWADKHPSYASVSGPGDGTNVDDYYSPEINSTVVGIPGVSTPRGESCSAIRDKTQTGSWTDSFENIKCYDTLKVNAILNEIGGRNHSNTSAAPIPVIFGMNFQAVSVGQKLIEKNVGKGGYLDGQGTPSALLLDEIKFVDASIGAFVAKLKAQGIWNQTVVIVTAKHGQSPIDPNLFKEIPTTSPADVISSFLPDSESPTGSGIGPTQDDISLLWLSDPASLSSAVGLLEGNPAQIGAGQIFYGASLQQMFNAPGFPKGDPRSPDIIVSPNVGVIYTGSSKKQEEHGGFNHDDTNVVLLVSHPSLAAKTVTTTVETAQVAPTILQLLGFDPTRLQSVQQEGTQVLPGIE